MVEFKFQPQVPLVDQGWKSCQTPVPPQEYNIMVDVVLVDVYHQVGDQDAGKLLPCVHVVHFLCLLV